MGSAAGRGRRRGGRRGGRPVGLGVAALVGIAGAGLHLPAPAQAAAGLTIVRVPGDDRYETAVHAAQRFFPAGSVGTVVLAAGASSVDALAAAPLAGVNHAPVLLTGRDAVPAATLAELHRLGARRVVVTGGEAVVGPAVVRQLTAAGFGVDRVAGADRYATAAALAAQVVQALPANPGTVLVAAGAADAAAVSPVAAARGWPVLLTGRDEASPAALAHLAAHPGSRVVVLGGTAVLPEATAAALGADERLGGADRFETAVRIARFAVAQGGFRGTDVGLAAGVGGSDGGDLADALTAGPALAGTGAPLLLAASTDDLGATTRAFLHEHASALTGRAVVFGAREAVGPAAVEQVARETGSTAPTEEPAPVAPVVPVPVPVVPVQPVADTTAPALTAVAARAAVGEGETVRVDGTASDDTAVTGLSYALSRGGSPVGGDVDVAPTLVSGGYGFDVAGLAAGSYEVTVTAVDAAGNSTSRTVAVTVRTPPRLVSAVFRVDDGADRTFSAPATQSRTGDWFELVFDRPVAVSAGAVVTLGAPGAPATVDRTFTGGVDVRLEQTSATTVRVVYLSAQPTADMHLRTARLTAGSGFTAADVPALPIAASSAPVVVAPAVRVGPLFHDDATADGAFGAVGDWIDVTFSEPIAAPVAGNRIEIDGVVYVDDPAAGNSVSLTLLPGSGDRVLRVAYRSGPALPAVVGRRFTTRSYWPVQFSHRDVTPVLPAIGAYTPIR